MLRFPYLEEPLLGTAPPSLPARSTSRWRPLIPVRILGLSGQSRLFLRALLDPGSDDTIFPLDVAAIIKVPLRSESKHTVRWRGQRHSLEFGDVELEATDGTSTLRWPLSSVSHPHRSAIHFWGLLAVCSCWMQVIWANNAPSKSRPTIPIRDRKADLLRFSTAACSSRSSILEASWYWMVMTVK